MSNIRSDNGSCLIIPRENDLIRVYMQLLDTNIVDSVSGRVDQDKIGPEQLLEVNDLCTLREPTIAFTSAPKIARKSLHPYKIGSSSDLKWWSVYNSMYSKSGSLATIH